MHYTRLAILVLSIGIGFAAYGQPPTKTHLQANIAAGRDLYHQHCSVCHGVDAKGKGSMYDPDSAEPSRRIPPADLTVLSERNAGKFPADRVRDSVYSNGLILILSHGTPDMPAWGHVFDSAKSNPKRVEERVRDLTAYIQSIQEGKK